MASHSMGVDPEWALWGDGDEPEAWVQIHGCKVGQTKLTKLS